MDGNTLAFIVAGYVFGMWLLYVLVEAATKSKEMKRLNQIQANLLIRMAEKLGVDPKDIQSILEEK